jgi:hypothetical protein
MKFNSIFVKFDNLIDIKERPTHLFRLIRLVLGKRKTQNVILSLYGYQSLEEKIILP